MKRLPGEISTLPLRTRINALSRLEKDPEGCFLAEDNEKILGFIYSRSWGKVGWFGTFAVLPEYQGQGIGKELINASLGYLRHQGCHVIGIETMPESAYNIGLYLKQGFKPRYLTIQLSKYLQEGNPDIELPRWSQTDVKSRERWIKELRDATMQLSPGFDYTREITCTDQFGTGETLVLTHRGRAVGMCTVALQSPRENAGEDTAIIQVLAIHPAHTSSEALTTLLQGTEALAHSRGKVKLVLPVNARHAWALEQVVRLGYRVERTMVRMTLQEVEEDAVPDELVNLSRWAG